ncbi:phosphoribosylamine--glycine ligase [Euryarchaeota archaeon]|jgi:fusion protein PurCD|nr:phosphoribosylamine--glycine ligase [Euryarchaeota archaeon]
MNFLVIGSGAREHIMAEKLADVGANVFSVLTNSNPGLIHLSKNYILVKSYNSVKTINKIIDFALSESVECVVIGPEDPLANGLADKFWKKGISVVGPVKELAQIETSKGFTRDLLDKYEIDASPRFKRFNNIEGSSDFIDKLDGEYVIKFDGLMGGKGVRVSGEHLKTKAEGLEYCKNLLANSGNYVIEEKLYGEEFSLMSFCDGSKLSHMPTIQDHKRAYENDIGPNTGGMGSYSDSNHSLPFLNDNEIAAAREINEQVASALLRHTGIEYKGILYGGFMATKNGIKLIEYNARFGDPEAMNLLSLLDTDFASVCCGIVEGNLESVKFRNEASVCKYIVPEGYGSNPNPDATLIVDERYKKFSNLYYAAVNLENSGNITTTSSRAAAIVATSSTIEKAEEKCEKGLEYISGDNLFVRHDIAKSHLIEKRLKNMEKIR